MFLLNKKNNKDHQSNIPVVYVIDDKAAALASVSIVSCLLNNDKNTFSFYLIVPKNFLSENKQKLKKIEQSYRDCHIIFIEVDDKQNYEDVIPTPWWSKIVFSKLRIPGLISEDKCIYLDADTLVLKNLKTLYDQNLEGYCIAGAKDQVFFYPERKKEVSEYAKTEAKTYVNTGVVLWNLNECRKTDIEKKFFEILNNKIQKKEKINFVDQDIINMSAQNKTKYLPITFNYQAYLNAQENWNNSPENFKFCATPNEWCAVQNDTPNIIHYCGLCDDDRPWEKNSTQSLCSYKWWLTAKKSPFFKDITILYSKAYKRAKWVFGADFFKID